MEVQSLQDLLLWSPRPAAQVIGGGLLYEQTKLVLFGGPKLGKSILAQQLAFCLSLGFGWLGFHTTERKVLYVQSEISKNLFRDRVASMSRSVGVVPPDRLFFSTAFGLHLDRPVAAQQLEQAIKRIKPEVLILDPKYKLIGSNDENSIIRFTDTLDRLIAAYGLTVIVIEHSRKPRMASTGTIIDMGGYELRGPIIEQWADSLIRLRGELTSDDRFLEFELRHSPQLQPPVHIHLDRNHLWFVVV